MALKIGIIFILFCKGRFSNITSNRFVCNIGKKAIWYYYAQGVGASCLYIFREHITTKHWLLKWAILGGINIVITLLLEWGISNLYYLLYSATKNMKKKCLKGDSILEHV